MAAGTHFKPHLVDRMAMALHTLADHLAFENIEGCEQGGGAMSLVVVREGCGAALLHRQARLSSVERLDLALLVNRQNDGVVRRIDIKADDVAQLVSCIPQTRMIESAGESSKESKCQIWPTRMLSFPHIRCNQDSTGAVLT